MTLFGPEYVKINTLFKRTDKGVIIPGEWALPEFEYLAGLPWRWTEKVDGTNIRLHWDGTKVTVGGRTDAAQVPTKLVANLGPLTDPALWKGVFPADADDVTVYGEGFGAGIQGAGKTYAAEQSVIVFDALVGRWWLKDADVADVAAKLGLPVVPQLEPASLHDAWHMIQKGLVDSHWDGARIEGMVGRPGVDLFTRSGERLMAKIKVADYLRWAKVSGMGT